MSSKVPTNTEIAEILRSVAASYQIENEGKNKFRIIAYNKAADAVEHATSELKDMWDEEKLAEVPGIGASISEHLDELFTKGHSTHFDEVIGKYPKAIYELMKVPGIGPKKAYKVVTAFSVSDKDPIEAVLKLAQVGKIRDLDSFGVESEADIVQRITEYKAKPEERALLSTAYEIAQSVVAWMEGCKACEKIEPLGSLRRRASTVGDIDIAVATNDPEAVLTHFTQYPGSARVIEKGDHSSSLLVPGNIQVDLMVQPPQAFGALLQHFTGSKHHNIALRELALKKGLSLSEYGIKKVGEEDDKKVPYKTEESFYKALGLAWIPPELREDTEEIEAAKNGTLPNLVELSDVKGDLQMHSSYDIETSHDVGASSMMELVEYANSLHYEYIAVTEHNPSQKGHTAAQTTGILQKKRAYVDELNYSIAKKKDFSVQKVFNSLEIDILPSGALPVSDEGMDTLDFALVSIHSSFAQSKSDMTKRVLAALAHPKAQIFAHPTARLLNKRESIELDWEKIFDYCVKNNKWVEINADPHRLDLPDMLVREAVKRGVKLTLGTDAHTKESLSNMQYGVSVARRGWATKKDIINSYGVLELTRMVQ